MPNTFAPRAVSDVVKSRTERLRMDYPGPDADVKEWHGILDCWDDESTAEFLERYGRADEIPFVVSGVSREVGLVPENAE